jgi:hypothetical protein
MYTQRVRQLLEYGITLTAVDSEPPPSDDCVARLSHRALTERPLAFILLDALARPLMSVVVVSALAVASVSPTVLPFWSTPMRTARRRRVCATFVLNTRDGR